MWIPVLVSSVLAATFAVLTYLPFQSHLRLHGASNLTQVSTRPAQHLNLGNCRSVFPRAIDEPAKPEAEASHCEDVVIHRQTGMAYLSCDPSKLTWDARAGVWDEQDGRSPRDIPVGSIWSWDTNKDRLPRKMFLSVPPPEAEIQAPADLHETFHPLGIAVTVSNPYFLDTQDDSVASKGEPPALLVLVANHPRPHSAGVIDVFVHDLDQFGGKDCNILRWIKRIEGSELESAEEGQEVATRINPYRIGVFEEQHSQSMPRAYPLPSHAYDASAIAEGKGEEDRAKSMVRIPSIFIVSLPDPDANNVVKEADSAVVPSYMQFVASLLRPAKSKKITGAPTKLYIHHSSVQQTMPAQMDGALIQSWKGFPPLLQVWDGNGVRGGSNTSASSLFLSSVDTEHSGVLEWDQHWVRGIPSGIKQHLVSLDGKGEPSMVVNTYTPSFVNFFDQKADYPVRALAIDRLGRFWTAGNRDTLAAEAWIESQRNEARRRTGSSLYQKQDAYPARPEVLIDQTTFLFRHMGRVAAHPWEFSKLAGLKKKGIFLRKEYHTFPVFRSAPETKDEIEVRSKYDTLARGFLPSVPTGMAVDHEKGIVFVTGAYEDRGVAKCTIPEAWAEK